MELYINSDGRWFLIHFDGAVACPQMSLTAQHLARETNMPEMFISEAMHNEKVDMWGVGHLINTAAVSAIPAELQELRSTLWIPTP